MRYHSACEECALNHDCLLQTNNSVEDCEDVRECQKVGGDDEEDFVDTTEEEDDEIEED